MSIKVELGLTLSYSVIAISIARLILVIRGQWEADMVCSSPQPAQHQH